MFESLGRDFGVLRIPAVALAVASLFVHGAIPGAHAQNAVPLEERLLLGVGTHQGMGGVVSKRGYVPAINIKEIKELGVTAFRDDFSWSDFELPGHKLGFAAPLGRLEAQITSGVARPILILGSSHYLVPNSNPPTTDQARQRFVEYAIAAAHSVANRHPLFELWNEWNISARQNPEFNADNYLALAQATYPAVKQAAPGAPFIIGAIGDDPDWKWTKSLLQLGLLKYSDGISIHLYNHCASPARRTATEIIERLTVFHNLVAQASGRQDFPIYVTETGWPTAVAKCGVSEQVQADNMSQLILWASTAPSWLKGISLYELKDSGINSAELEDNFGLYHFDNAPKPAVCAVSDSWAFVRASLGAKETKLADDVVLIKSTGGKAAIWSANASKHYQVRLKSDAPQVTFDYPCHRSPKSAAGTWMTVSSTPLLLSADGSAIPDLEIRQAQ